MRAKGEAMTALSCDAVLPPIRRLYEPDFVIVYRSTRRGLSRDVGVATCVPASVASPMYETVSAKYGLSAVCRVSWLVSVRL